MWYVGLVLEEEDEEEAGELSFFEGNAHCISADILCVLMLFVFVM